MTNHDDPTDSTDDDELQPAVEHVVPNVPEDVRRHEWLVWAGIVSELLARDGLSTRGLDHVRRELRPGGRWALPRHLDDADGVILGVPTGMGEQAAELLDAVTRRLMQHRPGLASYYANDLAPVVPDDASGLDGMPT
ncbi:hypothetical protein FB382_001867 [Nocardioides ginsengisegetis]|uniref:Uncharacterized protein n=1 Tax=Nocardioides ginsengisegetis TaxID=661491 RepID=A0A7W3P9K9_9ACTN|nr:hypothetical protein [Nocardioides ginsengisegetis]MBA8803576.1 hypothetical protein [Nocardioides ginsengisegetis]